MSIMSDYTTLGTALLYKHQKVAECSTPIDAFNLTKLLNWAGQCSEEHSQRMAALERVHLGVEKLQDKQDKDPDWLDQAAMCVTQAMLASPICMEVMDDLCKDGVEIRNKIAHVAYAQADALWAEKQRRATRGGPA